ncbi:MAG: phospholipid/cholesterol/gamma-HCH transport system substrate-binding protein [Solirubrobacteraceae bacterium]|jgi:phospholipid/cholesterol/gamma-HCH transport system substrate-binding protein|nr:phospholipid/cholesterol/gamma-HCH transport system substrate-binding protein [Solirubrobacteraceae bacterium]MDX6672403.1 phospholipid/cholesterol/gamma-HCH transport system substrate-binding protein [Solirubrobacteraceae bacterium]
MTLARILAVGAILVAVVVVAVILLSGGGGTTYKLRFQNAGQLVKGDEVQVGGRAVGTIKEIKLTNDNQAEVTVEMHEFAPLHEGTTAIIRATSLSGIANRYIALQLGPNSARELKDGQTIRTERTTTPVDLDQLFNALDPKTRKGLQDLVQGSAEQYQGKGRQANDSAKYFNPFIASTTKLVREVNSDQAALTRFIVESSALVTALADRRSDLTGLVSNANATTAAIANENTSFANALELLPTTLRRGNSTFVNLRSTLDDLDVLVNASKPVAPRLTPFFRELRPLVAAARPTIADLRKLVRQPGPNNDAVELLRKAPRLSAVTAPFSRNAITALRKSQPVIEFIRPYAPELVGWFRDFGQSASPYDANGHYARIAPQFNAFQFSDTPVPALTPQSPANRMDQNGVPNYFFPAPRRCPGAASQIPADNSAPWRDSTATLDCDPSVVPPGP